MNNYKCLYCETLFTSTAKDRQFCSVSCSRRSRSDYRGGTADNTLIYHGNCAYCQSGFSSRSKEQKFCSSSCSRRNQPTYYGGSINTSNGYRRIYVGRNKMRYEHQLVMEAHIGRSLNPGEQVHHIDEDKLNNDISNLRLITKVEHTILHKKKNFASETHKECCDCHETLERSRFWKSNTKDGNQNYCKNCANRRRRK